MTAVMHRGQLGHGLPALEPRLSSGHGHDLPDLASLLQTPPMLSPSSNLPVMDPGIIDVLLGHANPPQQLFAHTPGSPTTATATADIVQVLAGAAHTAAGSNADGHRCATSVTPAAVLPDIVSMGADVLPGECAPVNWGGVPPSAALQQSSPASEHGGSTASAGAASAASAASSFGDGSPPGSPGGSDGDTSGGEAAAAASFGPTTRRGAHRRPTAVRTASSTRRPTNPRPRWKCSAEFLVNSITVEERTRLTKSKPELYLPLPGETIAKPHEKALRKELRKLRNVESAKRSRRNQREYISTLETRLDSVESENADLTSANSRLSSSLNDALQQIARLRAAFAGSPGAASGALLMVAVCVGFGGPGALWGAATVAKDESEWNSGAAAAGRFRTGASRTLLAMPRTHEPESAWSALELNGSGMVALVACVAMLVLAAVAALAYSSRRGDIAAALEHRVPSPADASGGDRAARKAFRG